LTLSYCIDCIDCIVLQYCRNNLTEDRPYKSKNRPQTNTHDVIADNEMIRCSGEREGDEDGLLIMIIHDDLNGTGDDITVPTILRTPLFKQKWMPRHYAIVRYHSNIRTIHTNNTSEEVLLRLWW